MLIQFQLLITVNLFTMLYTVASLIDMYAVTYLCILSGKREKKNKKNNVENVHS